MYNNTDKYTIEDFVDLLKDNDMFDNYSEEGLKVLYDLVKDFPEESGLPVEPETIPEWVEFESLNDALFALKVKDYDELKQKFWTIKLSNEHYLVDVQ
jgi:hypothetical protein